MLLNFSVENYLSFKRTCSLNLEASSIKEHQQHLHIHTFGTSNIKLLKTLAIYGANSSGKSNLMKAFAFMRYVVINSFTEANSNRNIPVDHFLLDEDSKSKPSTFETVFIVEKIKYRYGFQISNKRIEQEWLFYTEPQIRENNLFVRSRQEIGFNKNWNKSEENKIETVRTFTRENVLFLSALSQLNVLTGVKLVDWFNRIILAFDLNEEKYINYTASLLKNPDYHFKISSIIKEARLGFNSIHEKLVQLSNKSDKYSYEFLSLAFEKEIGEYQISTKHDVYSAKNKIVSDILFDLKKQESLGTQKFLGLIGPLLVAINEKRILWIDELDSRFHSLLLEAIVKIFNTEKFNPKGAQLIFTSHNTQLLKKKLRRDQMIIVDKDKYGSTSIFSLYDKENIVRSDASFEKDYLSGKYKGVPDFNLDNIQLNLFD